MRFLHTSDWHLGRTFHGASLIAEQRAMVDRIVEIARSEAVSLVIIAGDLFDRAIPPAEAIDLFDHALAELRATGATVVAISGNHDSPVRVSSHDRILAEAGVIIRGSISRSHEPAVLSSDDGGPPIAVYAIPYLEPSVAAPILGEIDLEVIDLDDTTAAAVNQQPLGESDQPELALIHPDDLHAVEHPTETAGAAPVSNPTLFDALFEAEQAEAEQVQAEQAQAEQAHGGQAKAEAGDPAHVATGERSHGTTSGPLHTATTAPPVAADQTPETERPRRRAGHHDVTAAVTRRIRNDLSARGRLRSIVVSHTFLTGGKSRDSERELSMGSLSTVGIDAYDGFDYVALGHLHGRQMFDNDRVAYSGSPLPYSFSEERDIKSVNVVELGPRGELTVERITLEIGRPLRTIEGELENLLVSTQWADAEDARVRATLTDRRLPAQAMARLRQRFPHAVELRHTPPSEIQRQEATLVSQRRDADPVAMARHFLAEIHQMELDEADQALLGDAFAAASGHDIGEVPLIDSRPPDSPAPSGGITDNKVQDTIASDTKSDIAGTDVGLSADAPAPT